MRRNELAVAGFSEKYAVLDQCSVVRIGFSPCAGEATPFIVPVAFGMKAESEALTIYFHGAKEGRKINCFHANPLVSFEADRLIFTGGGESPCSWTTDFESVMGEGRLRLVEDEAEKITALDAVMLRYGFPGKPHYDSAVMSRTAVFALDVSDWVAKVKKSKRDA